MINRPHQNSVALALAVTTPCLAGLWLISVPQTISPSTYTTAMALLVALVGTTITMYNSGQGTGSMGQLLRAVELAPLTAGSRPVNGSATRSGS
jgi:hypothetical protein